jgi:hypothetical protein
VTELASAAFGALGPGPTLRELDLVARVLRSSGDEATLELFDEPENYGEGYRRLCDIAERVGASSFVALDLYCEVANRVHDRGDGREGRGQ